MSADAAPSSRIGRNFLSLGAGEAVARLIAFAVTVYLARSLGPALYGIIGVAMGLMLYFTQVADAGVELVGVPLIARDREHVVELAAPVLSFRVLFAGALTLVLVLAGLTVLPQPDGALLAIYALGLVATAASTRWVHLGLERTDWIALGRVVGEIVALVLIVALVHAPHDIGIVPLAQFLGLAVTSWLLLIALRARGLSFPVRFDWRVARPVFERSRHLVVFTLLGLLLYNFDLIFLRFVSGPTAAGYYAAAYTLISFAANLTVAFAHTVLPTLARLHGAPRERDALFRSSLAQCLAITLPAAIGGFLLAGQIIGEIFGAQFAEGVVAMQWLAWAIPLAALREIPVVALIAAGREPLMLRINGITAACNIALNVVLVPPYGLVGAASATLLTEIIRLALAMRYARQSGFDPTGIARRMWKPALGCVAMSAALLTVRPAHLWSSVPLGVVVYGLVMVGTGAIRLRRDAVPSLSV